MAGCRSWLLWFFMLDDARPRNAAMEGLRGYAAVLVFFVHFAGVYACWFARFPAERYFGTSLFTVARDWPPVEVGLLALHRTHHAVDLFFLLSGFLIMRLALRGQAASYVPFVWRRWLRIYPAFLISLILGMWLYSRHDWLPVDLPTVLGNLLFLNGLPESGLRGYNPPSWSLFPEFIFYLSFPWLYRLWQQAGSGEPARRCLSALGLFVLVFALTTLLPCFAMFLFGAWLGLSADEQLRQVARSVPTVVVLAFYLMMAAVYALFQPTWLFTPFFGGAASLLFLNVCYGEGWLNRLCSSTLLRVMGNISFSFYLMHNVVLLALAVPVSSLLAGNRTRVMLPLFFLVSFGASLAASVVLFAVAERWYFRTKSTQRSPFPEQLPASRAA